MTEGPGYGQYPRFGQSPYGGYRATEAPKPGIIPLRPLSVGEILDGAFSVMRWNPRATLVPSAIVSAISGVTVAVVTYSLERDLFTTANVSRQGQLTDGQLRQFGTSAVSLYAAVAIVSFVANMILTGILTSVIGQASLGRKETASGAWQATRSRLLPLIGAVLLAGLIIVLGWVVAIALSVGIGVLLGAGAHLLPLGILVGVVAGIAATVFAIVVGIRWSLAIPVVVLERTGPVSALRRSWRLVRGSAWRVFGILLLSEFIVAVANLILRIPFSLLGGASSLTGPATSPTVTSTIVSGVGAIIAGTVTTPVFAGVVVLLYTDLRMRREGMDIALRAASASPASAPEPPPSTSAW